MHARPGTRTSSVRHARRTLSLVPPPMLHPRLCFRFFSPLEQFYEQSRAAEALNVLPPLRAAGSLQLLRESSSSSVLLSSLEMSDTKKSMRLT